MDTKGVEIVSLQSTSFGSKDCNDDFMSEKELKELEEEANDNPLWVPLTKKI